MSKKNFHLNISFNSPVVLGFTIICFIALILNIITGGITNNVFFSVYHSSFSDPLTYFRFIGHVFGHANWTHFINNIMLILIVGPLLEEKYGSPDMIFVILATAIVTGLANYIFFPQYRVLGASGVVFAMILLSSFTSIKEGSIPLTFILVALIYIGQEVFSAALVNDNVSNFSHIVGGGVGSALGFLLCKTKNKHSSNTNPTS